MPENYHFHLNLIFAFYFFMIYITRKAHFNAAHSLRRDDWTDEQNREVFGKCANKNYHGHNFILFVTVKGKPDENTGFVMNLKNLGDLVNEFIIEKLDHKNLNIDVDFMNEKLPSIENMVIEMWKQLEPHLKGCKLHKIKLIETENNYVEYFGED
jgi:6-pyruvoyltetrahydropterin/6-carboxytetrahydropterin synthase